MRHSVALAADVHDALATHLLRPDGQEDLCFAIWHPSSGATRRSALISQPLLPEPGEREVHGNASFTSQYFLRAIARAQSVAGGVALLHSHPGGSGWQGMSGPDIDTERRHAPRAYAATGLPFVGMTLAGDRAWSARFWQRIGQQQYERGSCVNVRVVGRRLELTWDDALVPPPPLTHGQTRTISAWGDRIQQSWTRLRIAIVGTGSVGALIAEALARSGATDLVLIDFDTVEAVNLDRLLHTTARDAALARAKVEVLARALRRSATAANPSFTPLELSVAEPDGLAAALDCDVIFSCVDRPWPRAALNYLAYAHLIPVVDIGIVVRKTRNGNLRIADWRTSIATASRACLACTGQYDPAHVTLERDGSLDDPRYIEQLPQDSPLRASENVFGFSLGAASLATSQFLSLVVAPGGISNHGAQRYRFKTGDLEQAWPTCHPNCRYVTTLAAGDSAHDRFQPTGLHPAAQAARHRRQQAARRPAMRLARTLDDLTWRLR